MKCSSKNTLLVNQNDEDLFERVAFQRAKTTLSYSRENLQKTQSRSHTVLNMLPPLGPCRARSAPSSPRHRRQPFLSKTSSLTSVEMQNEVKKVRSSLHFGTETPTPSPSPALRRKMIRTELLTNAETSSAYTDVKQNFEKTRQRQSSCYVAETLSTPPLSPALRRKLIKTECLMKGVRIQIDNYRHDNRASASSPKTTVDPDSLATALEEVKNCRYLRVSDSKTS